jgi:hypothetical protein
MSSIITAILIFFKLVTPASNPFLMIVRFIVAVPLGAFGYRLRGGGYVTLPGTQLARLLWGIILAVCYLLAFTTGIFSAIPAAVLIVTGFLSVALVPHAYCQNMGTWPTPQKQWPSFFIPEPSDATWTAWPQWKRTAYDFTCMACVGLWRGLIVFLPWVWLAPIGSLCGVVVIMLLQAGAYLVGFYIPFSLPSVQAKSNEWGEFLTGAAWVLALGTSQIL